MSSQTVPQQVLETLQEVVREYPDQFFDLVGDTNLVRIFEKGLEGKPEHPVVHTLTRLLEKRSSSRWLPKKRGDPTGRNALPLPDDIPIEIVAQRRRWKKKTKAVDGKEHFNDCHNVDGATQQQVLALQERRCIVRMAIIEHLRAVMRPWGVWSDAGVACRCSVKFHRILAPPPTPPRPPSRRGSPAKPPLHPSRDRLRFRAPVSFEYQLQSREGNSGRDTNTSLTKLPLIMMEHIIVDVRTRRNPDGTPVAGYCASWVTIAIPTGAFDGLCQQIEQDTGFRVDGTPAFRLTSDGAYLTTAASFASPPHGDGDIDENQDETHYSGNASPRWIVLERPPKQETNDAWVTRDEGSLDEVYQSGAFDNVAVGIVGVSPMLIIDLPQNAGVRASLAEAEDANTFVSAAAGVVRPRITLRLAEMRILSAASSSQVAYFDMAQRIEM